MAERENPDYLTRRQLLKAAVVGVSSLLFTTEGLAGPSSIAVQKDIAPGMLKEAWRLRDEDLQHIADIIFQTKYYSQARLNLFDNWFRNGSNGAHTVDFLEAGKLNINIFPPEHGLNANAAWIANSTMVDSLKSRDGGTIFLINVRNRFDLSLLQSFPEQVNQANINRAATHSYIQMLGISAALKQLGIEPGEALEPQYQKLGRHFGEERVILDMLNTWLDAEGELITEFRKACQLYPLIDKFPDGAPSFSVGKNGTRILAVPMVNKIPLTEEDRFLFAWEAFGLALAGIPDLSQLVGRYRDLREIEPVGSWKKYEQRVIPLIQPQTESPSASICPESYATLRL